MKRLVLTAASVVIVVEVGLAIWRMGRKAGAQADWGVIG